MRLTWLGEKVLRLEVGLEHLLIAKTKQNFEHVEIGKAAEAKRIAFDGGSQQAHSCVSRDKFLLRHPSV